ncbi:MAG TPA: UTP--glucose-1-phosphate uridylyltransferase [Myxococcota bacterium]|nr:UTP--glucose-1-phosphate uridylyltransferase [Myxococcota bacterium]
MKVTKAVLPVAGLGTRFLPVTKAVPKEMLPLADRPCLEYIVAEAVEAGLTELIFVTAAGKGAMVDYFHRSLALEEHLEAAGKLDLAREVRRVGELGTVITVRQERALGLGHAVLMAAPATNGEDFAVFLGDDIIDSEVPAIQQLLDVHDEKGGSVVALMDVPREETNRYGICAGPMVRPGLMHVTGMVEKPDPADAPSTYSIVGRYVLAGEIMSILETTPRGAGGEFQLTDAIAVLAERGEVHGLEFEGQRFDTGNVVGLLRASIHFTLARPDLAPAMRAVLREFSS